MCLVWECSNKCGNYTDSGNAWEQAWMIENGQNLCAWCLTPPVGWVSKGPTAWKPEVKIEEVPEEIRWMYE
jgi:hypothetical protein